MAEPLLHCDDPDPVEDMIFAVLRRVFFWGTFAAVVLVYGRCDCVPRPAPVHVYGDEL